jgi:hypothetical protein
VKKLLYIPLGWQTKAHPELFESFCKEFITYEHEDLEQSINFFPDYIYVQSGAIEPHILAEIKSATNATVIQWTGDCRTECMDNVSQYKHIADLTLLAVGIGQREMYEKALGHPVKYLQQGVLKSFFLEPQNLESGAIVFIGNNYNQFEGAVERTKLCATLSESFSQFEVIGNGFNMPQFNNSRSIDYMQSPKIYNEAYISISHACFNDIVGYYSNRTLDIMASGGCCLMRRVPNIENMFKDMEHCVFYNTNEEAIEKIKMLIANPQLRNAIAISGQIEVLKYHSFDHRVLEIKTKIKNWL